MPARVRPECDDAAEEEGGIVGMGDDEEQRSAVPRRDVPGADDPGRDGQGGGGGAMAQLRPLEAAMPIR
jgi:hypothetical protein